MTAKEYFAAHDTGVTNTSSTSICYSTTSNRIDELETTIKELTKKPEVRLDQRSTLEVTKNQINARYYKDGFFTDSKKLIPAIKSIEVFNETTIKITFVNGNTQTATVQSGDPYFFEDGLLRCIVKEMIGKEGTAILGKLLSYATDFYNKAEEDKRKTEEEKARKNAISEKRHKRQMARWEKRRAKEREERIQEMAEAIVKAEEMKKNVNRG